MRTRLSHIVEHVIGDHPSRQGLEVGNEVVVAHERFQMAAIIIFTLIFVDWYLAALVPSFWVSL